MNFTSASTLDEALAAVASGARPIAGGSDLVVGARHGKSPMPARWWAHPQRDMSARSAAMS